MSLLPLLYSNWLDDLDSPHTLLDQHFGHGIHPEYMPIHAVPQRTRLYANSPRDVLSRCPVGNYIGAWAKLLRQGHGGTSTVKADKDQFQVSLDVQQFSPEEINVKVVDKTVIVEGKHEEKRDEHGFVSRQFTRRYIIPEQCDIDQVSSKLSSDGVLSIVVPRKKQPELTGERSIPIEHTGKPAIRENGDAKGEGQVQPQENSK